MATETPGMVCGPTTGCGQTTPMVPTRIHTVNGIEKGWQAPAACSRCGKPFGFFSLINNPPPLAPLSPWFVFASSLGEPVSQEAPGVWVVLDGEGLPEAVYCREDSAREYADDPNENKAGDGPFTVARFVRAASAVRLDGKPDVRDADGFISGDPMVASPELTSLRELATLTREYLDERNRPAVSWDGMPSVQDQKRRRERIVELLEAVHVPSVISSASPLSEDDEEGHPLAAILRFRANQLREAYDRGESVSPNDARLIEVSLRGVAGELSDPSDPAEVVSEGGPAPEPLASAWESLTRAMWEIHRHGDWTKLERQAIEDFILTVRHSATDVFFPPSLSASAPSPEDAPAEPTLVVGFNRETGNPTVEARSVETSDFCAACVRGYCEDRYSIRECRGHWHVTMCGADLAIPGDPFASAEIAQRAADAENRGRDPGGEA